MERLKILTYFHYKEDPNGKLNTVGDRKGIKTTTKMKQSQHTDPILANQTLALLVTAETALQHGSASLLPPVHTVVSSLTRSFFP